MRLTISEVKKLMVAEGTLKPLFPSGKDLR
jgi:hypothetical protein